MNQQSIKKNTLANYIGQGYFLIITVAITPLYLQYLSADAYGLIGFFSLMQAWLSLLDFGLTPTLGRQVAHARSQENNIYHFKKLLKSFEIIFLGISLTTIFIVLLSSDWISTNWLNSEQLKHKDIAYCINLMGIMIGLRWFTSLYRSGINGLEDQVWQNITGIIINSLKFIGALLLLMFVSSDVTHFFEFQLSIGVLELLILTSRFYSQLPSPVNTPGWISFHWDTVKEVTPYAMSITYTAGLWIFLTQIDKLILSNVLSLKEFGYFNLAMVVSGSINLLTTPITQAIQPRLTYLLSSGKEQEMLQLYRNATQLVTMISTSLAFMMALFSEQLIYAWTGNKDAAQWSKDILFWFALGNGILAILAFQAHLQVAYGKLRLHVIGTTLSSVIDIPIVIYSTITYGALGAGITWFILRTVWLVIWTPVVHQQFTPGLHKKWFFNDVLTVFITVGIIVSITHHLIHVDLSESRIFIFSTLIAAGITVLLLSAFTVSLVRSTIVSRLKSAQIL